MARPRKPESRACGESRPAAKKKEELLREIEELRTRLEEAEATIEAIQGGGVDALIVSGPEGERVFALEGADYLYRVMVEVMNEGVLTLDADGGILSCNSHFARVMQMPIERILGKSLAQFVIAGDRRKLHTFFKEAAKESRVMTTTLARGDGTALPVNLSAGAFEVGPLSALCVVVTDLRETLAAAKMRLWVASIVETSNDAVISKSLDGVILTWNAGAERIYGYSAEEAVGQPISIIVPRDRIQEVEEIRERICLGQSIQGYETVRITKAGVPIDVSLTVSPLMDPDEHVAGMSIIARDITERKKAEAELEEHRHHLERMVQKRTREVLAQTKELEAQRAKLQVANKQLTAQSVALQENVTTINAVNKEIESYSDSVSHDLRMPLRFVSRIAHLLLREPGIPLSETAVQQVNMILQATNEMGILIERLLLFSHVSRSHMTKRRLEMRRLFEEAIRELEPATEGRHVEFAIQNLEPCTGDRTLVKEVAMNLLANAVKFTRPRKTARITVGCTQAEFETVYFVQDNGVGFDMKDSDSLFLPFQRLHRSDDFEGTGIGLALVRRIIERHGGRIWAESKVDKGATFRFTLGNEAAGQHVAKEEGLTT